MPKIIGSEFSSGSSCAEKRLAVAVEVINSCTVYDRNIATFRPVEGSASQAATSPATKQIARRWVCDWKCSPFQICLVDIWSSFSPSVTPERSNNLQSHPEFQLLFFLPQLNSLGNTSGYGTWQKDVSASWLDMGVLGFWSNGEAKGSPPRIPDDWCLYEPHQPHPLLTATKRGCKVSHIFLWCLVHVRFKGPNH